MLGIQKCNLCPTNKNIDRTSTILFVLGILSAMTLASGVAGFGAQPSRNWWVINGSLGFLKKIGEVGSIAMMAGGGFTACMILGYFIKRCAFSNQVPSVPLFENQSGQASRAAASNTPPPLDSSSAAGNETVATTPSPTSPVPIGSAPPPVLTGAVLPPAPTVLPPSPLNGGRRGGQATSQRTRVAPLPQGTGQSASGPVNPASGASNNGAQGAGIENELSSAVTKRMGAIENNTSSLAILASLPPALINHLKHRLLKEAMWTAVIDYEKQWMIFLEVTPKMAENVPRVLKVAVAAEDCLSFTETRCTQQSFFQAVEETNPLPEIDSNKWKFPRPKDIPFAPSIFMQENYEIPFKPDIKEFVIITTFSGGFRIFYNQKESITDDENGLLFPSNCRAEKIQKYKTAKFELVNILELIRRKTEIDSKRAQTDT